MDFHVEACLELDEAVSPVVLPARHLAVRRGAGGEVRACALGVEPKALERAPNERREDQVLGCPGRIEIERRSTLRRRAPGAVDADCIAKLSRHRGTLPSGVGRRLGPMRRLRPLSEAECYARCYGEYEGNVRVLELDPPRRSIPSLSGEAVRLRFEQLLDSRDPEEAAEAAA